MSAYASWVAMAITLCAAPGNTEGPVAYGDGALGEETDQAAEVELPALDDDEEVEDVDDAVEVDDAAGFESEEDVEDDGVEDFDAAGELLDDEPRLSFR